MTENSKQTEFTPSFAFFSSMKFHHFLKIRKETAPRLAIFLHFLPFSDLFSFQISFMAKNINLNEKTYFSSSCRAIRARDAFIICSLFICNDEHFCRTKSIAVNAQKLCNFQLSLFLCLSDAIHSICKTA